MSRVKLRASVIALVSVLVLTSCGSDSKKSSSTTTADEQSETSAAVDTSASAGTDLAPVETAATTAVTVSDAGAVQDPAITALSALDGDAVCALFPHDAVSAIVGVDAGEPSGSSTPGLGSSCVYVVETDAGLVSAQLSFVEFAWSTQKIGLGSDAAACTIGDKEALCKDASAESGVELPASVTVKLGSDADYTMETNGETLDQAKALAELAYANLP